MAKLTGQHIMLGVCGGIAAYKAPELVRQLIQAGASVQVMLSANAHHFVAPLALETVSGFPVLGPEPIRSHSPTSMPHIAAAKAADAVLIAPASANRMAALAHGLADDLMTSQYLATTAPVFVAPAMNTHMWSHPATQRNLQILMNDGVTVIPPDTGEQACGDVGPGRLPDPHTLIDALAGSRHKHQALAGRRVLITTGPTQEPIDPVRFLTNRSSGKMGDALAVAAKQAGAEVILVRGPVQRPAPQGVTVESVSTAQAMHDAVMRALPNADIFIGAAAVADFQMAQPATKKVKKTEGSIHWDVIPTPDILSAVCQQAPAVFTVGFAAETHDGPYYAMDKRERKGCDLIVLNDVAAPGIGFEADDNAVTVFSAQQSWEFEKAPKSRIATHLMELIGQLYGTR